MMNPVSLAEFIGQAERVLRHYDAVAEKEGEADRVNFNWMARGEPLANQVVVRDLPDLTKRLGKMAAIRGLRSKFNVSTILPREAATLNLSEILQSDAGQVMLYYSLYSLKPSFRRRWLPKAMPGEQGLDMLAEYQARTGAPVALHWAFIKGENDDEETVQQIAEAVSVRGLRAKFNLVRYNPYSAAHGDEPDEAVLDRNFRILADVMQEGGSRIVPRIGFDVKASCGMFVKGAGARGRFIK